MMAFTRKGAGQSGMAFSALFLQTKGFSEPLNTVLPKAISILLGSVINDSNYDTLAMAGHRIGMVANGADLKQYLKDLQNLLKPQGRVLLTSISITSYNKYDKNRPRENKPDAGIMQFQSEHLTGPYFCTLPFNLNTLKTQAAATNWYLEIIYRLDDNNYAALLSMPPSG
jgi:hypothetical protein